MRLARIIAALCALLLCVTSAAQGAPLPPGRAWAPVIQLAHPGVAEFGYASVVRDSSGLPALVLAARRNNDALSRWTVLAWRDSAWADSIWSQQQSGWPPVFAQSTDGSANLLSISANLDVNGYQRLLLWPLGADVAPPETVAVTTSQGSSYAYSAALGAGRRWVARVDQPPGHGWQVRTYYSVAHGNWQAAPPLGTDASNCAIAPVQDSTCLLVCTEGSSSWWTQLVASQWTPIQPMPGWSEAPRFARRPAGGWWLVSEDRSAVHIDAWDGANWTRESTLAASRDPGRGFLYVGWCEPSIETSARPAIAWQEDWGDVSWHTAAHVAWPTDSGWTAGYQVPGSDGMFFGPTVALDRNGDAWLAWSLDRLPGDRWTHSYVSATTSIPRIVPVGTALRIDWDLSTSALNSWWAVLRDGGSGVFEEVARVPAGAATTLSWLDTQPPHPPGNPLRYRIRRESVDARYRWESPVAVWTIVAAPAPAASSGLLRLGLLRNPVGARGTLELRGAQLGVVSIVVQDIQGRIVASEQFQVAGRDGDRLPLKLDSQPRGVYLVTARDARGRTSAAIKLVRLDD